jgi:hypothetical protein
MVTLHRGSAWKISIYGREHGIPHFHIEGPGYRCSIAIETFDLIIGHAPVAALRDARAWARQNQTELRAAWKVLNG